jgi:uncharacterized protein YecE (DUF72 family)
MAEKEYIERDSVLRSLAVLLQMPFTDLDDAWEVVQKTPAADVVEVVHARWIDHKNGNATCSHCRIRQTAVYDDENEQNFCGHCGARMDGGKDDGNL